MVRFHPPTRPTSLFVPSLIQSCVDPASWDLTALGPRPSSIRPSLSFKSEFSIKSPSSLSLGPPKALPVQCGVVLFNVVQCSVV